MKIGILGLGNMGSAIAEAALQHGLEIVVWNRTAAKAERFAGRAAVGASIADVVARTDVLVWVLSDYATTVSAMAMAGPTDMFAGKVFVQLCSGTPAEARELGDKVATLGAHYLDGKIFTYPARVGQEMTRFAYSGNSETYDRVADILRAFGGRSGWLGPDPGFAAAADLAWLSYLYGSMVGLFQGLAFARAEGLADDAVFQSVPSWLVEIEAEAEYSRALIQRGDFRGNQANLDVHLAAMQHLLHTARANRISTVFPSTIVELFGEAVARGHGALEITGGLDVFVNPP
ncbi:MAG: NAD(P)-dependent oxidoreductase [Gemmobacter sp.]